MSPKQPTEFQFDVEMLLDGFQSRFLALAAWQGEQLRRTLPLRHPQKVSRTSVGKAFSESSFDSSKCLQSPVFW